MTMSEEETVRIRWVGREGAGPLVADLLSQEGVQVAPPEEQRGGIDPGSFVEGYLIAKALDAILDPAIAHAKERLRELFGPEATVEVAEDDEGDTGT